MIDVCSANYKCIGGQIDSACSAGVHPVRLKVVVFVLEIDLFLISKVANADPIRRLWNNRTIYLQ